MKWVWVCLLMCCGGNVLASDYGFGWAAGSPSDPWTDSVQPSGLRWGESTVSVQTGSGGGGNYVGGPIGPGPCNGCGICTHWAVRPWYAPWGQDGIGYKPCRHHGYGQACCVAPDCNCD
jgi:hypothetical protein